MLTDPAFASLPADGVDPAEIIAKQTPAGGWTKAILSQWGVPWPAPKGWRQELERRWREHDAPVTSTFVNVVFQKAPEQKVVTIYATVPSDAQIEAAEKARKMAEAIRELRTIECRYRHLPELATVFAAANQEIERLAS